MPDLDTNLIMHHLSISLGVKPVKKKLRKMHPRVALLVKAKLEKILSENFIRAIDYAKWIPTLYLCLNITSPFECAPILETSKKHALRMIFHYQT